MKQIEMMRAAVAREEEKSYELEIKSKSVSLIAHIDLSCVCLYALVGNSVHY